MNYSILVYLPNISIAVNNLSCLCLPDQAEGGEENVVKSVTELTGDNIGVKVIIFAQPGHSIVDGKVKRVGKANESIDDQNNVLDNIVINETEAETKINH